MGSLFGWGSGPGYGPASDQPGDHGSCKERPLANQQEILVGPPLSLPSSTTDLTCFFTPDKVFTGTALVGVGHAVDAERIRLEYSGQLIDNSESDVPCTDV